MIQLPTVPGSQFFGSSPAGMTLHSWGPKLWRKPSLLNPIDLLTYWEKPDFLFKKKKTSNDEGPQVLVVFHTVNLSQKKALDRGVNGRQTIFGQHNITSQNFTDGGSTGI